MPESKELPWTGERLVTSIKDGDIVLEHLHRYAFAAELVAGKDVLDIACGEGYGSHLLASNARSVTGVDISEETIRHARAKYVRANLTFHHGSCLAIPIPNQSVDVVVSFETLEHFAEQEQFLAEVRRVLRPGGIAIISTPDKAIYTGKLGNRNNYHPRELSAAEFETLLRDRFAHVKTLSQRVGLGSFLAPTAKGELIETGTHRGDYDAIHFTPGAAEGVYLIGVASDAPLPALKPGLFEFGHEEAGAFLTPLVAERKLRGVSEHHLAEREAQLVQLNRKIQLLNQAMDSVSQLRAEAERRLTERNVQIGELKKSLNAQRQRIHGLDQVVASAEQWQRRSWFRRAFHRWHPPGTERERIGFLKKLERSLRKRRKRLLGQTPDSGRLHAPEAAGPGNPNPEKAGFFKRLERSLRKRRKRILNLFRKGNLPIANEPAADFSPLVTVIVPNFNHVAYLRQRLDSIYRQSYKNFNVLLLDDCSQDGSLDILNEYASKYPTITRIIRNPSNGGTPFKQWKRGIREAEGDLLWIAESDDFCDASFLKTLVPFFRDSAMALAFCRTDFVDEQGEVTRMTYPQYVKDLGTEQWAQDYVATAHNVVNRALGIKNVIPNASGVLFKKPRHLPLLEDPAWLQMKICGDWIFYLHLIRGGKVGFSRKTKNYYRSHAGNASAFKNHRQPFYFKEHEIVAKTVARLYKVGDSLFDQGHDSLKRYWEQVWQGAPLPDWTLDDHYKLGEIKAEQSKRLPNVLIACHDFGGGGGEMFPIRLANELHEQGNPVVFYDFNGLPANPEFKKNLSPSLPLIRGNNDAAFIASQIADFGADLVHTHHLQVDHFFSKAVSLLQSRGQPTPRHIVTLHGMYEISMDLFRERQHELIPAVDHWIYTADKNLEPFKEVGRYEPENFTKIPLAIKIRPAGKLERSQFNIPPDAFVVCVASRALPEKGWEETIEAVGLARSKSGRDIHLLLAGEGPVKKVLSQRALPPYVHLLGYQKEIVSLYAMSDLGLLASTYKAESCPLTIIECLSAERPVVATALGEIPAMLTFAPDKTAGTLIELENWKLPVAKFADAICRYATDEVAYRNAAANCLESAKRYSLDLIAKKYGRLYDDVFRGRQPADTAATSASPAQTALTERATLAPMPKVLAWYLPQFHPIPENDAWWGKGFTEWRNVTRARPLFPGHAQPQLPADLGFYDLRLPEVRQQQADLARKHGIHGFVYHYYWFKGRKVLETPLEEMLRTGAPDFPFCINWANENWTRRWDGMESEILLQQEHSLASDVQFIREVMPLLKDRRYVTCDGKPVLIVYRAGLMKNPAETAAAWRDEALRAGLPGLHLCAAQLFGLDDPRPLGFDALIEFPPHYFFAPPLDAQAVGAAADFNGKIFDFPEGVRRAVAPLRREFPFYRGAMPGWDNTARRMANATVYHGATPEIYQYWLHQLLIQARHAAKSNDHFVFINAWNEWAEGAHLEPDQNFGCAWLEATRHAIEAVGQDGRTLPAPPVGLVSAPPKPEEIPSLPAAVEVRAASKEKIPWSLPRRGNWGDGARRPVLCVSHDAARAGAQLILLRLVEHLAQHEHLEPWVLLRHGGALEDDFRKIAPVLRVDEVGGGRLPFADAVQQIVRDFRKRSPLFALCNTVVSSDVAKVCDEQGIPVLAHVLELPTSIDGALGRETIERVRRHARRAMVASGFVRDALLRAYQLPAKQLEVVHYGIPRAALETVNRKQARQAVLREFGWEDDAFLVLGCGSVHPRKGTDLFVQAAIALGKRPGNGKMRFLWVGGDQDGPAMRSWCEHDLAAAGLAKQVRFAGERVDPRSFFAAADAFALTSREDPFPTVNLEAMAAGLPVVAFADAGGAAEAFGDDAGLKVPYLDVSAMADELARLAENPAEAKALGARARQRIESQFASEHFFRRFHELVERDFGPVAAKR